MTLGVVCLFNFAQASTEKAPEFVGNHWVNTVDGKPATLAARQGKVTLVAFWTFDCINCRHNLAPYERILAKYRPKGVDLISVHTPELPEEHNFAELKRHVDKFKISYPVLVDNNGANWDRWHLTAWPTLFVVDSKGLIRYHWVGELNYDNAGGEAKIGEILDGLLSESSRSGR